MLTEMGMWIDLKATKGIELSGLGNGLWKKKKRCLNDAQAFGGC